MAASATITELPLRLFKKIVESGAIVKSQQRGEEDLTFEEKSDHLQKIYDSNKLTFIYKFGKFLDLSELELFETSENYELRFYVDKFKRDLNPIEKDHKVRNRRYNYLENVLKNSDYFKDEELARRDPLLYHQYVAQYKTDQEIADETKKNLETQTFSQFLMGTIDRDINTFRCELELEAQNRQEEMEEEEEEEEEEEIEKEEIKKNNKNDNIEKDTDFKKYLDDKIPVSSEERARFREEFVSLMENKFLNGEDDFDYSQVDDNEEYDSIIDQDFEDKYFDEEDPT